MPEPDRPALPATASGQARPIDLPKPTPPPLEPSASSNLEPADLEHRPARPPFDAVRAAFYLVAGVIGAHAVIVLASVAACLVTSAELVDGKYHCHPGDTLSALLAEAMAAALAFAGFSRKP